MIDHIASNQLGDAGVATGDKLYVITFFAGHLYVVTSIVVDQLVTQDRAEKILGRKNLWEAEWHAIPRRGTARLASMSAPMSDKQVASLVFISKDGRGSGPARNRHGLVDPQTFRTTRRIDATTAALFEKVLSAKL